jgi:hypothetical protein
MTTATILPFDTPRTLHIDRLQVARTDPGGKWTLYEVFASENGKPITEPLRTFDPLEGDVEVTADAYIKDGAIQHYTLKPTKRNRRSTVTKAKTPGGDHDATYRALEARVEDLERKMAAFIKASDEAF